MISLVEQGCRVVIGARDTKKSEQIAKELNARYNKNMVEQYYLDLGHAESVRDFSNKVHF